MPEDVCQNRLTIVGPKAAVQAFNESGWEATAKARHVELLESSPKRAAWQFETQDRPPLLWLVEASQHWPKLTFLLDYEIEEARSKGLAKARDGAVEHHRISY